MRMMFLLGWLTFLAAAASSAAAQGSVLLYDPAAAIAERSSTDADLALAKEKLAPRARARWSESEGCNGSDLNVIGAVDGSFTRAGARQRAVVYELCQTGNGFANNGIAILENNEIVAHLTEEGGWDLEVSRVPDLNKNGRDELAIETGGGMHQGYTGSSLTILEVGTSAVRSLGTFLVYSNACEKFASGQYCDRSYKLTAAAGAKPVFFAQKFTNRGDDEKPRWVAAGKPLPARPVSGVTVKFEAVK